MFKVLFNNITNKFSGSIVTIGNFDGMHLGHLQLINRINDIANKDKSLKRVLITFEPLPLEYFADINNQDRTFRLNLLRDKFLLLKHGELDFFIYNLA